MKKVGTVTNRAIAPFFALFLFFGGATLAQSNEDCMMCHEDEDLTMEVGDREVSMYVDYDVFRMSSHGKQECVACHVGYDPMELPHREDDFRVNCVTCHKGMGEEHAFHPQMAGVSGYERDADVNCVGCHGDHDVYMVKSKFSQYHVSNQTKGCGKCHPDQAEEYKTSAHHAAMENDVSGAPGCTSCHESELAIAEDASDSTVVAVKLNQTKACLSCHLNDPDVRKTVAESTPAVESNETNIHGRKLLEGLAEAPSCAACHNSHTIVAPEADGSPVAKTAILETCADCHAEIADEVGESLHGLAFQAGDKNAPLCADCHDEHHALEPGDPNSSMYFRNTVAESCVDCHDPAPLAEDFEMNESRVQEMKDSYHGFDFIGGKIVVTKCAGCHTPHLVLPASAPESPINPKNVAETCFECHPGAYAAGEVASVHDAELEIEETDDKTIAGIYLIIIIALVGLMAAHHFFHLVRYAFDRRVRSRKRKVLIRTVQGQPEAQDNEMVETKPTRFYERMCIGERLMHGFLFVSFFILAYTGHLIAFPKGTLADVAAPYWCFDFRTEIHLGAAALLGLTILWHLVYLVASKRGRDTFVALLPNGKDVKDFGAMLRYIFGGSETAPRFGRFSYMEKSNYWLTAISMIVLVVTGAMISGGVDTNPAAAAVHFWHAALAVAVVVVWHLYYVFLNPIIYPMNPTWLTGKLAEDQMEGLHPEQKENEEPLEVK